MKTTTVVNFSTSTSTEVGVLELDPIRNITSDGDTKTTFQAGEQVFLSLHYDREKYKLSSFYCSTGELQAVGMDRSLRTLENQFFSEPTIQSQYIVESLQDVTWYGVAGTLACSGTILTVSYTPAMVDVSFFINHDVLRYIPDSYVDLTLFDSFPVGIVCNLEEL